MCTQRPSLSGRRGYGVEVGTMAAPQGGGLFDPLSFAKDLLAGGVAAAISKMAVVPVERVKPLLQVQASSKQIQADQQYKGMIDCFVHISREQGIEPRKQKLLETPLCRQQRRSHRGLHHGLLVFRVALPERALNFAFKNKYKPIRMSKVDKEQQGLLPNPKQTPLILSFFIAQVVTMFSGMLSYPFDTVRRRMMMQEIDSDLIL
nr:ADP/ATP translocase 4 isoform X1 [Anser cygnoides]